MVSCMVAANNRTSLRRYVVWFCCLFGVVLLIYFGFVVGRISKVSNFTNKDVSSGVLSNIPVVSRKVTGKCNMSGDSNMSKALEPLLQEAVGNIPDDKLYRYLDDQKVFMTRRKDECGYYVTDNLTNSSDYKLFITREVIVGLANDDNTEQLNQILTDNGFVLLRKIMGGSYLVLTSDSSPFIDGLQMSQLIYEKYRPWVKWAENNFVQVGMFDPL